MFGAGDMIKTIQKIASKFPDNVATAIYQEAQIEMTESKRRVPVDTGILRSTGYVDTPVRAGRSISVILGYNTEYAIYVHENLEAFHPVGQAKYLESVLNESTPHMMDRIAKRIHFDLTNRERDEEDEEDF